MRRTLWVALFGIAMAAVESAVVVYLRALHYELPTPLLAIEVAREAATLVMLIAVAALARRNRWEGFLYFALAFGLWDIFYYVWCPQVLAPCLCCCRSRSTTTMRSRARIHRGSGGKYSGRES